MSISWFFFSSNLLSSGWWKHSLITMFWKPAVRQFAWDCKSTQEQKHVFWEAKGTHVVQQEGFCRSLCRFPSLHTSEVLSCGVVTIKDWLCNWCFCQLWLKMNGLVQTKHLVCFPYHQQVLYDLLSQWLNMHVIHVLSLNMSVSCLLDYSTCWTLVFSQHNTTSSS